MKVYYRTDKNGNIVQTLVIDKIIHYFPGEDYIFNVDYTTAEKVRNAHEMKDIIMYYRDFGYVFRNYAEANRSRKKVDKKTDNRKIKDKIYSRGISTLW